MWSPSPVTWIEPLSNVFAVDQSTLAQLRPGPGVTGLTSRQSSAPPAPPVLPIVIVSVTEPREVRRRQMPWSRPSASAGAPGR